MKKTYTKKQIVEAIKYWKKKLNEDMNKYEKTPTPKVVPLAEIIDSFEIFDRCSSWHGPTTDIYSIKFSSEQMNQIDKAFSSVKSPNSTKVIGIFRVLSPIEHEDEDKRYKFNAHDNQSYDDYIEDVMSETIDAFTAGLDYDWVRRVFKPNGLMLFHDVEVDGKEGCSVIVAAFAVS